MKKHATGLGALFTFMALFLIAEYFSLLFASISFSFWFWPFLFFSAFESAYFSAFFLTPRTPYMVRVFELILWLLPLFFLSGGFNKTFAWTSLFTFLSWLIARGFGSQIAYMENITEYVGDHSASTVGWEYEALDSKEWEPLAIEYFWWQFLGLTLLSTILGIVFRRRGLVVSNYVNFRLSFLRLGTLISGLGLLASAYLVRLQMLWVHVGATVDSDLVKVWVRNLVLVVFLIVIVANVLPINYSPITAERIGNMAKHIFIKSPKIPDIAESPQSYVGAESIQELSTESEPDIITISYVLSSVLILIVVGLIVLLVIGLLLFNSVKCELNKLKGLPLLVARIYAKLRALIKRFLETMRKIKTTVTTTFALTEQKIRIEDKEEQVSYKKKSYRFTSIRAQFRQLIMVGAKKGLSFSPNNTPSEFEKMLQQRLDTEESMHIFFENYRKIRYSEEEISEHDEKKTLQAGREVLKELNAIKRRR